MRITNIINKINQNCKNQPAFGLKFGPEMEKFIEERKSNFSQPTLELLNQLRNHEDNHTVQKIVHITYQGWHKISGWVKDFKINGDLKPTIDESFHYLLKQLNALCQGNFTIE